MPELFWADKPAHIAYDTIGRGLNKSGIECTSCMCFWERHIPACFCIYSTRQYGKHTLLFTKPSHLSSANFGKVVAPRILSAVEFCCVTVDHESTAPYYIGFLVSLSLAAFSGQLESLGAGAGAQARPALPDNDELLSASLCCVYYQVLQQGLLWCMVYSRTLWLRTPPDSCKSPAPVSELCSKGGTCDHSSPILQLLA